MERIRLKILFYSENDYLAMQDDCFRDKAYGTYTAKRNNRYARQELFAMERVF